MLAPDQMAGYENIRCFAISRGVRIAAVWRDIAGQSATAVLGDSGGTSVFGTVERRPDTWMSLLE